MKKKWLVFSLIIGLIAGFSGASVYAWLIDTKEVDNAVRFVQNKVHIEEEFDPPPDPKPGDVIVKKPSIVNDSVIPVYVRARICFTDSDAQAQCEPLVIREGWDLEKDGYYYYRKKLETGEGTTDIFDNIVIKNSVKKEELIPFDILVYGEAVQARNYASPQEAFEML
ncbi:hypothetical protein [Ruminococcus sp. 5_1_39BFAA]|uniref:hypothetical protein n=1 Tax=Ruminococcus sp. 5_1_39BFAA TaxID=457412 RepID=UPI003564B405